MQDVALSSLSKHRQENGMQPPREGDGTATPPAERRPIALPDRAAACLLLALSVVPPARAAIFPNALSDVGSGPGPVISTDLNGDGRLDLAVSNFHSGDVSILLGKGDG